MENKLQQQQSDTDCLVPWISLTFKTNFVVSEDFLVLISFLVLKKFIIFRSVSVALFVAPKRTERIESVQQKLFFIGCVWRRARVCVCVSVCLYDLFSFQTFIFVCDLKQNGTTRRTIPFFNCKNDKNGSEEKTWNIWREFHKRTSQIKSNYAKRMASIISKSDAT